MQIFGHAAFIEQTENNDNDNLWTKINLFTINFAFYCYLLFTIDKIFIIFIMLDKGNGTRNLQKESSFLL